MTVTPRDIAQKRFSMNKRGYEPAEVDGFLEEVRDALEAQRLDALRMSDQLAERDREIARLRAAEGEIKETLVVARRFTEDMQGRARRESELLLGEARLEAQRILGNTHDEHRALLRDIARLRHLRHSLLAQLRAVVDAHGRLLSEVESDLAQADRQADALDAED